MGIIAGNIILGGGRGRANVGLILEEPTRKERAEETSAIIKAISQVAARFCCML